MCERKFTQHQPIPRRSIDLREAELWRTLVPDFRSAAETGWTVIDDDTWIMTVGKKIKYFGYPINLKIGAKPSKGSYRVPKVDKNFGGDELDMVRFVVIAHVFQPWATLQLIVEGVAAARNVIRRQ